jgi:hypothetical protein
MKSNRLAALAIVAGVAGTLIALKVAWSGNSLAVRLPFDVARVRLRFPDQTLKWEMSWIVISLAVISCVSYGILSCANALLVGGPPKAYARLALPVLGACAAATEVSLISTWHDFRETMPDPIDPKNFISVWTAFWPFSVAITLILAGAVGWATNGAPSRRRVVASWIYFLVAVYLLILLNRHLWVYEPGHSGPAL